jgi:signal transduction histidine kinase
LEFPEVARLELDFLLQELRDRASDVLAVQGRLRGLLRANAAVTAELSLPAVLRRVVEAARHLLNARYAALGVIGSDGQLEQFVHSGMSCSVVESIGHLPRGHGVLGLLIREPVPIRLADLASHPASSGFPPSHPPMRSFLGVPIRVGEAVFGNLYVTERVDGGQFSAEDEQLATALAVTASGAIANARLFYESEHRRRWLVASSSLTNQLLTLGSAQPLSIIAEQALTAAEADFATLELPHGDTEVIVAAGAGALAADLEGRTAPLSDALSGQVMGTGQAIRIADYHDDGAADPALDIGPLIVAPLTAGERARGALVLGRASGTVPFTDSDLTMAAAFTRQAAVALELAESREAQAELMRMQDHDRIAGDMHDHVIQQLFAIGMGLQGLASITDDPSQRGRLSGYVDALDQAISAIRTTIFQLRIDRQAPADFKTQILDIATQHTSQLGFSPTVRFAGPLNETVTDALAADVLAVIREATSNCARHAQATRLEISIELTNDRIVVEVVDNGRGIGTPSRSSGLASLRRRAERHHGTLTTTTPDGGGTHLTWTALTQDRT